jgi:DNA-binding response OmpR family regulator
MASTKTRVLVAEDDPNIRLGLEEVLRCEDFEVDSCDRGDKVLDCLARRTPDLVVLDVMLPGLNGYEICRKIRERNGTIPILMLTAKGQEIDKVVGFEAGADDYVTKPFGVRELLARINALLRRSQKNTEPAGNGASRETGESFQIGTATIDPKTFQIKRGKTAEPLTAKELKLLQFLHAHPGEVLSRDRLLNEVWGYNYYGTTRTLDQTISQLRKKLGDHGENPRYLLTVHGVGYKLV